MRHGSGLLLSLLLVTAPVESEPFFRGEVDGDGSVELTDAVVVLDFLFLGGTAPGCLDAADTNDDGELTLTDGIFLLSHLFLGSTAPPPPEPTATCPGEDPTADSLDCESGVASPLHRPTVTLRPVFANLPGVRHRSRIELPVETDTGRYLVPAGTSFTIVVEATSNPLTQAGFSFTRENGPGADPQALRVVSDRALGDPERGGVAAGANLAPQFLRELELWVDPIYLVQDVSLRVDGSSALAPTPGIYRFTGSVTDTSCGPSAEASFELEVLPPGAPEIFAWIERAPEARGEPAPHEAATGNPRVAPDEAFLLVVEARPNGVTETAIDPGILTITSAPPLRGGENLTSLFQSTSTPGRWSWLVNTGKQPMPRPSLTPGNVRLEITAGSVQPGSTRVVPFLLEVEVSFEHHVRPILTTHCTGCHERPEPEKGLELVAPGSDALTIWRRIVNVFAAEPAITSSAPVLVRPLYPKRSYLYHKLRGTHLDGSVEGSGERMPLDAINYLPADAMATIQGWIEQGALRP